MNPIPPNKYGIIAIHPYPPGGKEITLESLIPYLESKAYAALQKKLDEECKKPVIEADFIH